MSDTNKYDILMLSEAWGPAVKESTSDISCYKRITSNRENRVGACVAIFVHETFSTLVVHKYNHPDHVNTVDPPAAGGSNSNDI